MSGGALCVFSFRSSARMRSGVFGFGGKITLRVIFFSVIRIDKGNQTGLSDSKRCLFPSQDPQNGPTVLQERYEFPIYA